MSERSNKLFSDYINPLPAKPSSMWQAGQLELDEALGAIFPKQLFPWKKWPGSPNFVVERNVWACRDGFWADFKFAEYALLNWFWTAFIPSPVEVERKLILGSYKCGFYFFPGPKAPLEVIADAETARVFVRILGPITTLLFYLWAAETAWSALDTLQTIMHKEEFCEDLDTVLVVHGNPTTISANNVWGGLGIMFEDVDPSNVFPPTGSSSLPLPAGDFAVNACFTADIAANSNCTSIEFRCLINGVVHPFFGGSISVDAARNGKGKITGLHGSTVSGGSVSFQARAHFSGPVAAPFAQQATVKVASVGWGS